MRSKVGLLFLRFVLIVVFLTGLLANSVTPAYAAVTCYVKYNSTGEKDGTSWDNAFNKLQSALGATSSCTDIWVAKGTYKPTSDASRSATFLLKNNVKVYGGFSGGETLVTQRNPTSNVTILSGNIGDEAKSTDNSYHVVMATGTNSTAVLDGVVVEDGYANGTAPADRGAAFYADGGSPTIHNVIFRDNIAKYGAALFINAGSTANLSYVTVQNNEASLQGGGMYLSGSTPEITNSLISDNSAQYGGGIYSSGSDATFNIVQFTSNDASVYGAGMYNASSTGSLANVTFYLNAAAHSGGGMYNHGSSPALLRVAFNSNSAVYYGGGMYNGTNSAPSVRSTTFTSNTAEDWGGGMLNSYSDPILRDVAFELNDAYAGGGMFNTISNPQIRGAAFISNTANDGGGIYNDGSDPSLENITFWDNEASHAGGAITNYSSNPSLNNVTIAANIASILAGGIHNDGSLPVITNSIVYGNQVGEVIDQNASISTISNSIVEGGCPATAACVNVSGTDPQLSTIGLHGGTTKNLVLAAGSPAVDTGDNATCAALDQRGVTRPQDGDGDGVADCDMGATEASLVTARFKSTAAYDGFILESTENSNQGGTLNNDATTVYVGDNAVDKQYRSILSFNTSTLPDAAQVTKVYLRIQMKSVVGTDPFTTHGDIIVDIMTGGFSGNGILQATDFQAVPSKLGAGLLNVSLGGGLYRSTLNSSRTYVNKTGITQLRLRFNLDDNDNGVADYLKFYSGNYSDPLSVPKLVVQYFIP